MNEFCNISVCLATYNGAKYIKEQLASILIQLGENDEVIISDDSSEDNTLEIINSFQDERIKIYSGSFRSPIYNFENALKRAKGEIIFLSDQDDIWFNDKVKLIKDEMKDNLLLFSNALIINENLQEGGLLYKRNIKYTGYYRNLIKNRYIGATMVFRRNLLNIALPFPKNIPMHDQWLGLLAEMKGKTHYIDVPLIYYRRHSQNVSFTGSKSKNSFYTKLSFRAKLVYALLKRVVFSK